jgi:hypothetical protein
MTDAWQQLPGWQQPTTSMAVDPAGRQWSSCTTGIELRRPNYGSTASITGYRWSYDRATGYSYGYEYYRWYDKTINRSQHRHGTTIFETFDNNKGRVFRTIWYRSYVTRKLFYGSHRMHSTLRSSRSTHGTPKNSFSHQS